MKLHILTFLFTLAGASLATSAVQLQARSLVENGREAVKGGHLIYYGVRKSTKKPGPAGKRIVKREARHRKAASNKCSSSPDDASLKCDGSNGARNDACDRLVTELYGDGSVALVPGDRQVCYQGTAEKNAYCCVSWGKRTNGLTKGAIADYGAKILSTCTLNGVSGRYGNVKVGDQCASFCMSNRGTKC